MDIQLESLEDLVNYTLQQAPYDDSRWTLGINIDTEYVDPEAGKAWQEEFYSLKLDEAKRQEMYERQPETRRVRRFYLQENNGYRRHRHIQLGTELGEQLEKVWATRQTQDDTYFSPMTLGSAIKRLARTDTDIAKRIKAVKKAAEDMRAKDQRNYARGRAREKAQELLEILQQNPTAFPNDSTLIANLEALIATENEA